MNDKGGGARTGGTVEVMRWIKARRTEEQACGEEELFDIKANWQADVHATKAAASNRYPLAQEKEYLQEASFVISPAKALAGMMELWPSLKDAYHKASRWGRRLRERKRTM